MSWNVDRPLRGCTFNGLVYGVFGFDRDDGEGVCFSFYEYENYIKRLSWKGGNSKSRARIKQYLIFRDGLRCKYCKCVLTKKDATIDHFVPAKMWQSWLIEEFDKTTNLVLSCSACNLVKGSKSPVGFSRRPPAKNTWQRFRIHMQRNLTRLRLMLNGTRTLKGHHKGHYKYMSKHGIVHKHKGAEHNENIII